MTTEAFKEEIIRITNEVLESGELEETFRANLLHAFEESFSGALRYGDLKKAIENRINEVMVPYVEKYDIGAYVTKLDEILSQLLRESAVADNRKILENFSRIMGTEAKKVITLEELFDEYNKHVAADVNTDDLEIDYDDGVSYQYVTTCAEIVESEKPYSFGSSFEHAMLYLHIEASEDLSYPIRLSRWEFDRDKEWYISFDIEPSLPALSNMNSFEAYLHALDHARTKLTFDKSELWDSIKPDAEPEATFS